MTRTLNATKATAKIDKYKFRQLSASQEPASDTEKRNILLHKMLASKDILQPI